MISKTLKNRLSRRSQAALEFVMTYGWAILVVLVAIGALAYFGVLSPANFLPNRCTLSAGISCDDHLVQGGAGPGGVGVVTARLTNSLGRDLDTVVVKAGSCGNSGAGVVMANGASTTFTINCAASLLGSKYSGQLNVSYTVTDTSISHNNVGQLITRIE